MKSTQEDQDSTAANEDYYNSKEYYDWYYTHYAPQLHPDTTSDKIAQLPPQESYAATGYFNSKTGKFQSSTYDPKFVPSAYFNPADRAARQMSGFFDYQQFAQNPTTASMNRAPPKKLTKKEVEMYKKKRKEKKEANLRKKFAIE
jgi:hypothetical protein